MFWKSQGTTAPATFGDLPAIPLKTHGKVFQSHLNQSPVHRKSTDWNCSASRPMIGCWSSSYATRHAWAYKGSTVDCVLWAHNDNDAKQSWTVTGLTLGWRKRLSPRTVTHWHVASDTRCALWAWDYCGFTHCVYRLTTASCVRQEVVGQAAGNQKCIPKTQFQVRGRTEPAEKVVLFCLWRLRGMTTRFLRNLNTCCCWDYCVTGLIALSVCGFNLTN